MKKKQLLYWLIISSMIFLVSCGGGPATTDYRSGTQGLELRFLTGFPERSVYERDPVPVVMIVANKGAYTIPQDKLLISWSYDPLYLLLPQTQATNFGVFGGSQLTGDPLMGPTGASQATTSSLQGATMPLGSELPGRSTFYPQGDELYVEEYALLANPIAGMQQSATTTLTALACYEYETLFSREVCVDVDSFLRTGREQVCQGTNIRANTQGAPIAFTTIDVRAHPITTGQGFSGGVRPEFIVQIRNVGQGILVAPPQQSFVQACGLQGIPAEESGAVRVSGTIFNVPLSCNPEVVRLRNNEGTTRCTISDAHLDNPALVVQQNVVSVLELRAQYIYRSSLSADITIQRNPTSTAGGFERRETPQVSGYAYSGGEVMRNPEGDPITTCAYERDGWSCSCSPERCQELIDGFCVRTSGQCPAPQTFCCDEAGYENFKNEQAQEQQIDGDE